jgi:hybrid polyketide synthase/nonribosomal peptide synthetase ACE1
MRTLGIKPEFGSVESGYLDLTPVGEVVRGIVSRIVADEGDDRGTNTSVQLIPHRGSIRVRLEELAEAMQTTDGLSRLRPMNALDWFGEIKKAGFGHFITSHHLVMRHRGAEVVSRR